MGKAWGHGHEATSGFATSGKQREVSVYAQLTCFLSLKRFVLIYVYEWVSVLVYVTCV